MALQEGVQHIPEFMFTLNNTLRREDARAAANCILRDIDVSTLTIPTKEELQRSSRDNEKLSKYFLQYAPKVRDTKDRWKSEQQNEIGTKRDLEYLDAVTRPHKKYPTYASLFRTMAPPYTKAYYIHKLFTLNLEDLSNQIKRRAHALMNPTVIEWVISLHSELDIKYLSSTRYKHAWYVTRNEHGAQKNSGNCVGV